jgi:hypothetical protein
MDHYCPFIPVLMTSHVFHCLHIEMCLLCYFCARWLGPSLLLSRDFSVQATTAGRHRTETPGRRQEENTNNSEKIDKLLNQV